MSNDIYIVIEHIRGKVAEISYLMLAAGRQLADSTGGELAAVLLGADAESLVSDLAADKVIYFEDAKLAEFTPGPYVQCLVGLIEAEQPRALLLGHTSIGMEVASLLSVKSSLPLITSCLTFSGDMDSLTFTSQLYGGKILAEGEIPGPTALLTLVPGGYKPEGGQSSSAPPVTRGETPDLGELKVTVTQYIEPEAGDVDIATENLLVAVGRGVQLQDNIELAEELAEVLSGVVCASRPVVDQGWMPTTRLVGKSGYQVKPKVYIALGISGAPEHTEGITGSETIIAVNTDPAAPIFNIAKYGVVEDIFDLVPVLTEKLIKN
ncbi:MAG: electron transfer flavoprotein subunit alpha/FixB family protein [Anaerolineales bacterium]|nr:electron transfer flavoprotein subunit alpha/FixB family protein [Anaerolineales bacterium]